MINKKIFIGIVFAIAILMAFGFQNSSEHKVLFEKAKFTMETKGDLKGAIKLFEEIIQKYPDQRDYAAKSQLYIGLCYEKLGLKEAQKAFQKVVENYPEQIETVNVAREKLITLTKVQTFVEKGVKEFRIRQVWAGPDVDTSGELSPDGKYLSFADMNSGDLAIRELVSGKKHHITKKGSWDKSYEFVQDSRWSPDGKRLAYAWFNKDNFLELRIIGLDGSKPRILYREKDEWVFPTDWSPDGKYILVYLMRGYKNSQAGLISVKDGSLQVLKEIKSYPRNGIFSPDGSYIVYDYPQEEDSQEHDILLFSIAGKREIPVVNHPADDWVLGWVPDSNIILFSSDRTGTYDAWMVEVADGTPLGKPKLIRKELGQISPLGFTNKGSFYYSLQTGMVDVYISSLDLKKGTVLAQPEKVTQRFVGSNYLPDWSPDGEYLAYISERKPGLGGPGSHILCIRSDETGEVRELFPKLKSFGRLRWAPDGRSIFVTGSDEEVFLGLYKIDVKTGDKTLVAESEPNANIKDFTFSLDGKSVFYAYFEWPKKRARIMRHDLETGQVKEVYRKTAPPDIGQLSVSPDGKYLAFITAEPGWPWFIRAIPIAGGESQDLIKIKSNGINTYAWTPDGKEIIFAKDMSKGKGQACELWQMPLEGGEPQKLLDLAMERMRRLSIHPDGKRITFYSGKSSAEIWVMENFLPEEKAQKKSKSRQ